MKEAYRFGGMCMFAVGMFSLGHYARNLGYDGEAWVVVAICAAWLVGAICIWVGISNED